MRETSRRGLSLTDVAVGLLAEAFSVTYTPTGRRSTLPGSSPVMLQYRQGQEEHPAYPEFRAAVKTAARKVRVL